MSAGILSFCVFIFTAFLGYFSSNFAFLLRSVLNLMNRAFFDLLLFWQTSDPDFSLNFKNEYLPAPAILSIKFLAGYIYASFLANLASKFILLHS